MEILARSEWFSSGFVAFPSSLNSTVCSLFQNFTKVGYSRRKPSRGRQLPTQHLSTESDPFCTEVPSLTTCSALCSIFSSNFSHRRGNLPGHVSVFSDGTELPCRHVTESLSTILASAGVDGNVLSKTFLDRFSHFWKRSRHFSTGYSEL